MNKFSEFINELMTFTDIRPVIHLSPAKGYRARAEFGWNKGHYTMMADGKKIFIVYLKILIIIIVQRLNF